MNLSKILSENGQDKLFKNLAHYLTTPVVVGFVDTLTLQEKPSDCSKASVTKVSALLKKVCERDLLC